ncbi:unnamed protein product [Mucor hiemalis]
MYDFRPEQETGDRFEKTPTACLYRKNDNNQLELKSWGKAAIDHITKYPDEDNTVFVDQFKLKLSCSVNDRDTLCEKAAIDYLREIHQYTCTQLVESVYSKKPAEDVSLTRTEIVEKTRYVLTIPSTWAMDDSSIMREIAFKAGLIDDSNDPQERLVIISEAQAASLYCEKEYYNNFTTVESKKGQRYMVCDAGGGTVDLSTFEYTEPPIYDELKSVKNVAHCQLALEGGEFCGSIFLDQNMKNYLRDNIFVGCIDEKVLGVLVDQFSKKIKHYFGDDGIKKINLVTDSKDIKCNPEPSSTTIKTTENTSMISVRENDYDYDKDYEENYEGDDDEEDMNGLCVDVGLLDSTIDDFSCDGYENFTDEDEGDAPEITVPDIDFVYLTLPESGIDRTLLDNLELKGSVIKLNNDIQQLCISHHDIRKNVFDPVVDKVVSLIYGQIKKAHTTIDTLFLLGGFGQSPYLYKIIHEEFITSTNTIKNLIVPENGYRASMRGGILYGIDCVDIIPKYRVKDSSGRYTLPVLFGSYDTLIGIDFNFFDLSATYTFLSLEGKDMNTPEKLISDMDSLVKANRAFNRFNFDYENFINKHYKSLLKKLHQNLDMIESNVESSSVPGSYNSSTKVLDDSIYYDEFVQTFIQQLFQQFEKDFAKRLPQKNWDPEKIRYSVSIASKASLENNTKKDFKSRLLSKIQPSDEFSVHLTLQTQRYLLQVLENTPTTMNTNETEQLSKCIHHFARTIGMVKQNDSEDRIFWCGKSHNSSLMHNYILHRYASELSKSTNIIPELCNVMTKDKDNGYPFRSYSQSIYVKHRTSDVPKKCYIYTFDLHGINNMSGRIQSITERGSDENGVYDVISSQRSALNLDLINQFATENTSAELNVIESVNETGETIQIYELEKLLEYIGKETNFMSTHVRTFIKSNVDLLKLQEKHRVSDMFVDQDINRVYTINVISIIKPAYDQKIEDSILYYKQETITTEVILKLMIIPRIENRLSTAIINFGAKYCPIDLEVDSGIDSCLIFEDEIVQTKTKEAIDLKDWKAIRPLRDGKVSASVFLFQILQAELQRQIESNMWEANSYSILST